MFNKVAMIGLGYIGLPTAAILASRNVKVIGVDIDELAVNTINKGKIHLVEPELETIVREVVSQGLLRATTTPEPADAFLIAVPTPFMGNYEPDTRIVEAAARSIASVLKKGDLIILESTSPVGTTEKMAVWLAEERPDLSFPHQNGEESDINIAYCPERVLPGNVLRELVNNDRVIGGMTPLCSKRAVNLYKKFVKAECIITNARTAEMCKLTENSFRDVNIAFANEISLICDELEINVWELIKLTNRHPRVEILQPGPGVGGHCIAVDPWFIVSTTPKLARLVKTARQINDKKPNFVVQKVKKALVEVKGAKIAILGLTFKPNIDDIRESPSIKIVEKLNKIAGIEILICDPYVKLLPRKFIDKKTRIVNMDEAIEESDVIAFLVKHREFTKIDKNRLNGKKIIDACGLMAL